MQQSGGVGLDPHTKVTSRGAGKLPALIKTLVAIFFTQVSQSADRLVGRAYSSLAHEITITSTRMTNQHATELSLLPTLGGTGLTRKNVIVLTHGWTGSSIFSALFREAGYWLGGETMVKPDYDTFENTELVALNNRLLHELAPTLNHEHQFSDEGVLQIATRSAGLDLSPYRKFIADCNWRQPWLWKDPRLTWTVRAWEPALDMDQTAFLVLTRDPTQAWISANLRRHVQSYGFTRSYNGGITQSNLRFLQERGLNYLELSFEDLLLKPEDTLAKLNGFFNLGLSLAQLNAVCRLPLRRKSRNWKDFTVASLIYMKNFGERDGRNRLANRTVSAAAK